MSRYTHIDIYDFIKGIFLKEDESIGLNYYRSLGFYNNRTHNPFIQVISHHPALWVFRLKHIEKDQVEYRIGRRLKQSSFIQFATEYLSPIMTDFAISHLVSSLEQSLNWNINSDQIKYRHLSEVEDISDFLPDVDDEVKLIYEITDSGIKMEATTRRKAYEDYLRRVNDLYLVEVPGVGRMLVLTNLLDPVIVGTRYFTPIYSEGNLFGLFYGVTQHLLYDSFYENKIYNTSFSVLPTAIAIFDKEIDLIHPVKHVIHNKEGSAHYKSDLLGETEDSLVYDGENLYISLFPESRSSKVIDHLITLLDRHGSSRKALLDNQLLNEVLVSKSSYLAKCNNKLHSSYMRTISLDDAYMLRGMNYEKRNQHS